VDNTFDFHASHANISPRTWCQKTSPLFVAFVSETLNLDPINYVSRLPFGCLLLAFICGWSPQVTCGDLTGAAGGAQDRSARPIMAGGTSTVAVLAGGSKAEVAFAAAKALAAQVSCGHRDIAATFKTQCKTSRC
jgi:hypothetical protein